MAQKLAGKVAIVTGASKGIGAGIASHLAAEGASVVVNYSSDKEGAERVVKEIEKNKGKAIAIKANITDEAELKKLFAETVKKFGHLDILVNNAGVFDFLPLEKITSDHFHKMFNLNVLALLLASKTAVEHFNSNGGNIVNIGSVGSIATMPNSAVYSATKASVDAITKVLSKELGPHNIRVNAVNPGAVITEGLLAHGLSEEFRKEKAKRTPLGRLGQPKDIGPAVAFLVSDDASWITGESIIISGGLLT